MCGGVFQINLYFTDKMQDYPSVSFPYHLCPHGKKREVFTDYGNFSYTDVDKEGQVYQQKHLPYFVDQNQVPQQFWDLF